MQLDVCNAAHDTDYRKQASWGIMEYGALDIHTTSALPIVHRIMQGLHEVLAELERAHLEYHRSEHRPMLYSASPDVQRAYSLVEGTYQDVGALPGHPATFRISKVHHILSMQVC
jgi:hypothetical protein